MITLGFDTSAAHVAAAIYKDGQLVSQRREAMSRGQAERLMGMLDEILAEQNLTWSDLTSIGVGIGPGNFTGIRISVSAARGLALGLGIPAVGINRFEVIKEALSATDLPCVLAPQNKVYVQEGDAPARLISLDEVQSLGRAICHEPEGFNPAPTIARLASERASQSHVRPAPLYIKAADAAPARDAPPRILP